MKLNEKMMGKILTIVSCGITYVGECIDYTPANDNDPEVESVAIQLSGGECLGFYETEIDSVFAK